MCTRGVYQLRKISLYFCDFGGSSTGVRQTLVSPQLKQFIKENEHIDFNFIIKRNHHPFMTGSYINGYLKDIPLRSLEKQKILNYFDSLKNQLGRKSFSVSGIRSYHPIKSIQGKWSPNMFNTYPRAQLQKMHKIPRADYQFAQKQIRNRGFQKDKDTANVLLQFDQVKAKNLV